MRRIFYFSNDNRIIYVMSELWRTLVEYFLIIHHHQWCCCCAFELSARWFDGLLFIQSPQGASSPPPSSQRCLDGPCRLIVAPVITRESGGRRWGKGKLLAMGIDLIAHRVYGLRLTQKSQPLGSRSLAWLPQKQHKPSSPLLYKNGQNVME